MKKERISIAGIKDALRHRKLTGVPLPRSTTVSQLYGTFASLASSEKVQSVASDWASVSYVHTSSAIGSGGMPAWVAEDVEQILDGLIEAKIISERAIWFDRVGMRQTRDWPALATLHCLGSPVICVPPTRTVEYSRYQIPDKWDAKTFEFFTAIENMLRSCTTCGSKCPMEFDSRLLNIAAALRAWPINEAALGSASRGAFISFATLDRIQYTISWYQVLLQIALDLGGYGIQLLEKSVELFGKALFQPCSRCLAVALQLVYEEGTTVNCQLLDDTLVALLMQANRFALPAATEKEGLEVWSLEGLYRSPGEGFHLRKTNSQRLQTFSRKSLSQTRLEEIAANICRGRPSLASCFRDGDKWLCAIIISNLHQYLDGISSTSDSFSKASNTQLIKLLKLDRTFGDLYYRDSTLEVEVNRCIRSPTCTGRNGSVCFFNELSGVLVPTAVGEFFRERRLPRSIVTDLLSFCQNSLRRRLLINGIALLCYEFKNGAAKDYDIGSCGACFKENPKRGISRKQLVLFGWKAKDTEHPHASHPRSRASDEIVYSFVTLDAEDASHVQSRGIFSRSNPERCPICKASFIRTEVEGSSDLLEIHVRRLLPITTTVGMVYEALSKCHDY